MAGRDRARDLALDPLLFGAVRIRERRELRADRNRDAVRILIARASEARYGLADVVGRCIASRGEEPDPVAQERTAERSFPDVVHFVVLFGGERRLRNP